MPTILGKVGVRSKLDAFVDVATRGALSLDASDGCGQNRHLSLDVLRSSHRCWGYQSGFASEGNNHLCFGLSSDRLSG